MSSTMMQRGWERKSWFCAIWVPMSRERALWTVRCLERMSLIWMPQGLPSLLMRP